ncbi:O-antigen ligase family protein [Novosphingobium colocasiae]|uniref:O-antigen ligase family protein n=1 Tax=Novosphingobium colocasiae TaxID=1256513 RepID=UPI0035B052DC
MTGATLPRYQGQAGRSRLAALCADRNWQDGVFAALMLLSRIPANLGTAGGLAFLLLAGLYTLLRLEQAGLALRRCWPLLVYPAVALLSASWADFPELTLRAAVQMTVTAYAGLLLSQAQRPRTVLLALLAVYGGYTVASWLAGNTRADGLGEAPALFGLGGEAKNYFADTTGTAVLLALAGLAMMLERRAWAWSAALAIVAAICVMATLAARSAGAVAALLSSGALLAALLLLRQASPAAKLLFVIALVTALVLGALFFDQLLALVQQASNKDEGLTGRGYLWYRAAFYTAERPWLGVGYFGFWTAQNPEAIGLWRYFDVRQEGTAFSFHNGYIQTWVETGLIGVAALVLTWAATAALLLRRFVITRSLPACFWLAYLAHEMAKTPVEPIRPSALVAPTIMMFAAAGFGCLPVLRPGRQ